MADGVSKHGDHIYREVVDNLHEGIWAIDKDANTTFVNARMADMLGYTTEEMIGQHLFSFMDDRGREICERNLERRRQGIAEDHEFELLRKDGARVYTIMQSSPITDQDGNYAGALAGVLDITKRRNVEKELHLAREQLERRVEDRTNELRQTIEKLEQENEERKRVESLFRQLLESAPDAMVVANADGEIILVSALTKEMFGYSKEELIGSQVEMLIPQRFRGGHIAHRKVYAANAYVRPMAAGLELYGLRKDGHEFPAEVSLGPLQTEQGMLVFTAIRDITARKRAEDELRESRERFDLAVRGSDAGIWDWDLRTNEVYFSPRWKGMIGYTDEEVKNDFFEWEQRLHPDDRQRALATVQAYLSGETREYELEHRLRHKDGSYRWILARGAAVRDSQGNPYRMVGSHIDISERKIAEEMLRDRETQLRAAQTIQQHLLPDKSPRIDGFDIAGASVPAEFAAGDHFDYIEMSDGTVGVVIGDVSGHGFSSALLMASVHAHLRSLAEMEIGIDEILTRANSSLVKQTDVGHFITVMFVRIDPHSKRITFVSAGHPAGIVLDRSGVVKARMESTSFPLAVLPNTEFTSGDPVTLEPGDIVILLTDGVLEATSATNEFYGEERAIVFVHENRDKSADEIAAALCREAREFHVNVDKQDDVTAVVIKVEDGA
ncbi:MAG: PAS domain S-box protein [Candidatus Latescibacterota bacterium]|nr:MAG: PAS domain S-box protein [Candidatus Latescibacterota bacterium]